MKAPHRPSRRRFLGGAAVALALPGLPSLTRAESCKPVKRLLVYHVPNGVHRASYTPSGVGTTFTWSPSLAPLQEVRSDVLVIRGLANWPGVPVPSGGAHACGMAALLTCHAPAKDKLQAAISVDQVAAQALASCTRLPSLQLGLDTTQGAEEPGWGLVYPRHLSWAGATNPLPNIVSPQRAFDRLFAGFDPNASRADAERRRRLRASVLDTVWQDAKRLHLRLSATDQRKLDEYLSSVREHEVRVKAVPGTPSCALPTQPFVTDAASYVDRLQAFHQIMLLALKCDATRVITFSAGNALSQRSYPHLGIAGDAHALTHHAGNTDAIENTKKIDLWRAQMLTAFVKALKAEKDLDGQSLLASTGLVYTSEIADGDQHDQMDRILIVAGQMGGAFKTGRLVRLGTPGPDDKYAVCDERTRTLASLMPRGCVEAAQLGDFYMTLLQGLGVSVPRFGMTGTKVLTELAG